MRALIALLVSLPLTAVWADPPIPATWDGFQPSPHFGEWLRMVEDFDPDARYLVNVAGDHSPDLPTHVIFFGTPSGNRPRRNATPWRWSGLRAGSRP